MNSVARRLLAAAAGIVLLGAVQQLLADSQEPARILVAGVLIGTAVFLFTFVIRPESAFFGNRDDRPSQAEQVAPAGPVSEPEILDLTEARITQQAERSRPAQSEGSEITPEAM